MLLLAEKPGSTVNLSADEVNFLVDEATSICVNQPATHELEATSPKAPHGRAHRGRARPHAVRGRGAHRRRGAHALASHQAAPAAGMYNMTAEDRVTYEMESM